MSEPSPEEPDVVVEKPQYRVHRSQVGVAVRTDSEIDLNVEELAAHKPHFLDCHAVPPPPPPPPPPKSTAEHARFQKPQSNVYQSIDKIYERDGEISDSQLLANGYARKEFTQSDNSLRLSLSLSSQSHRSEKPRHFLDENPIAPDYMCAETREPRSLDRNFNRQNLQRFDPAQLTANLHGRRTSLERGGSSVWSRDSRESRARYKEQAEVLCNGEASPSSGGIIEPKVKCAHSLASLLGSHDALQKSQHLLELSRNPANCSAVREYGCIPLLVQIIYSSDNAEEARKYAGLALHNIVLSHPDMKGGRRELKVLRLLDQVNEYCGFLKTLLQVGGEAAADDTSRHPLEAISSLLKISFDQEHRAAMCELGALYAIPNLLHLDNAAHCIPPMDETCSSVRRFALSTLTNLTFGDDNNKAILCSQRLFMAALVSQLVNKAEDLLQVAAGVLRNLSWRADSKTKRILNEVGAVNALTRAAMKVNCENALSAVLSALWNLSAHCVKNKSEICAVEGAIAFLIRMLSYESPHGGSMKVAENAGGVLRNISNLISMHDAYRQILRDHNCLSTLLQQLKSASLTVVSNACGILWNISARCPQDQEFLLKNGAIPMLRSLVQSKHSMISEGSKCALKNLLDFQPNVECPEPIDPIARSLGLETLPTLNVRKQRALEEELKGNEHYETCENIDVGYANNTGGGVVKDQTIYPATAYQATEQELKGTAGRLTCSATLPRSDSHDSILSIKSDSAYENMVRTHPETKTKRRKATRTVTAYGHGPVKISTEAVNAMLEFEGDLEPNEEQPTDYSAKYNETAIGSPSAVHRDFTACQEANTDQPTNFSLRYGENLNEASAFKAPMPAAKATAANSEADSRAMAQPSANKPKTRPDGNEILFILEDSVRCYQTEDTPYVISNAGSVTDLRQVVKVESKPNATGPPGAFVHSRKYQKAALQVGSGSYTPEKPINYCEEGTPGCFSRYDSLSSLDDSPEGQARRAAALDQRGSAHAPSNANKYSNASHNSTNVASSNLETPLMFSRHSSMDSLIDEDVGQLCDDKSSIVSEFSRLASGIISPSDIPDSPTQAMARSPRKVHADNGSSTPPEMPSLNGNGSRVVHNLSFGAEEPHAKPPNVAESAHDDSERIALAMGHLTLEDSNAGLAKQTTVSTFKDGENIRRDFAEPDTHSVITIDEPKHYCTEDTPALLSKAASNTNLSVLSIESSNFGATAGAVGNSVAKPGVPPPLYEKPETDLSDDSICSAEDSAAAARSNEILEKCIRAGIEAKQKQANAARIAARPDPMEMMRCGGNLLPPYLPVNDEMNKYVVEDSPCNFSVVSGLSNLTVGSSRVGPAVKPKDMPSNNNYRSKKDRPSCANARAMMLGQGQTGQGNHMPRRSDSLSSLSSDSEINFNILNKAIAVGSKRAKGRLSSNSTPSGNQFLPLKTSSSTTALRSDNASGDLNGEDDNNVNNDDSSSSFMSSDSNDNRNRVYELCVLSGMYKNKNAAMIRKRLLAQQGQDDAAPSSTRSNPNLKQFEPLTGKRHEVAMSLPKSYTPDNMSSFQHYQRSERDTKEPNRRHIPEPNSLDGVKKNDSRLSAHFLDNVPKNVPTTSAGALERCPPVVPTLSKNANFTVATPDVEKNPDTTTQITASKSAVNGRKLIDTANDQRTPAAATTNTDSQAPAREGSHQCREIGRQETAQAQNGTGSELSDRQFSSSATSSRTEPENMPTTAIDKHKDPDLMMRSVERLTQELIQSAVYLRTHGGGGGEHVRDHRGATIDQDQPSSATDKQKQEGKPLNALDVEHHHHSAVEANIVEPNEERTQVALTTASGSSMNLSANKINFKLGGEVKSAVISIQQNSECTFGEAMTSSAMIALEARTLADNLQRLSSNHDDNNHSVKSLELEDVCPPSGMESLNVSGCFQAEQRMPWNPHSPQFLRKTPKLLRKPLAANLMAKRAIGQLSGSAESVNSSCNLLDNIKPPSLMDELLDSMISVDSIQSEIAECDQGSSMDTTISGSNYETAADNTEYDDLTVTLQSCLDNLDHDDDVTLNDASSGESTPRASLSGTTEAGVDSAVRRRRAAAAVHDRYKTYTISGSPRTQNKNNHNSNDSFELPNAAANELTETEVEVEIGKSIFQETNPPLSGSNSRRRSDDRYKTQTIKFPVLISSCEENGSPSVVNHDVGLDNSLEEQEQYSGIESHNQQPSLTTANAALEEGKVVPEAFNSATIKIVRGRKKPSYQSPYSAKCQHRKTELATIRQTVAKKKNGLQEPSIEQKSADGGNIEPLQREGTFTKDEPTNSTARVPIVEQRTEAPKQSADKKIGSKLPTKRMLNGFATPASKPSKFVARSAQRSNTSIRLPGCSAAASRLRPSATTPPSRSNSNLNGNSLKPPHSAQSRVAGIWRRTPTVAATSLTKDRDAPKLPPKRPIPSTTATVSSPAKCAKSNRRMMPPVAPVPAQAVATANQLRSRLPVKSIKVADQLK